MKRGRTVLCAAVNFLTAALALYSVATFFFRRGDGNMQVVGAVCLRYFTVDSNLLCAVTCLAMGLHSLLRPGQRASRRLTQWKLAGTSAVSVTMLTVLLFLGPTMGYRPMFVGVNLHLHLICPLLAILSWCLLDPKQSLSHAQTLAGVLPTAIYALVYLVMVLILGRWPDFYGFNMTGLWYLSAAGMLLGSWLIALSLRAIGRKSACILDGV